MGEPFYNLSSILNISNEWSELINNACFDIISRLPEEVSTLIFRLLDPESLFSAALVNHNWLAICHSESTLRNNVRQHIRRSRKRPRTEDDQESPTRILSLNSQMNDNNVQSSSPEPYLIRRLVAKRTKRSNEEPSDASTSKTEHSRWLRKFGARSVSEEALVPTLRFNLRI